MYKDHKGKRCMQQSIANSLNQRMFSQVQLKIQDLQKSNL